MMAEDLKAYQDFKRVISELGNIKLAWFTTYNFKLDFFEKYVLSALVHSDPFDLRGIKDYEILNDRILNSENGPIDIKVFHDFRALEPDIKRTSIQTIGIKPEHIGESFTHGVFHPKVALIVNYRNEAYIISGSANLTISAWSRNSEGIVSKPLLDIQNAQAITDFFTALLPKEGSDKSKLLGLNNHWQNSLSTTSDWKFSHSISGLNLLEHIQVPSCPEMVVWSPYFSEEFNEIIESHFPWVESLKVIPDMMSDGTIRLTNKAIETAVSLSKVQFLKDLHQKNEDVFVHAKVWCTPSKLAIGSWNFTKAGLNLSQNANNIEAGIIQDLNPKLYKIFQDSCKFQAVDRPLGVTKEELEESKHEFLFNWKINCQIFADWSNYQYRLLSEDDLNSKVYYFDLPGKKKRAASHSLLAVGISFYEEHKSLLKDRFFSVYDSEEGGERVYLGVIVELNAAQRPSIGFESIQDLLRAWSDRKPEKKSQLQQINYSTDIEAGDELSTHIAQALKGDYSNAWFTMFLAFEQIKVRLKDARENTIELNMIGFRIPGSITQISEHLKNLKEKLAFEDEEMSSAFIWFMIHEGNLVIDLFNSYKPKESPMVDRVENIDLHFSEVDKEKMKEWLKFIQEKCSYS